MTIIYFLIALSILILVHEWGHFITARLFGVRVEQFSLGFGPKLFGRKKGDTEYKVCALPFGGYVKMSGDELGNVDKSDKGAFYNKPVFPRIVIVVAGAVLNIIFAAILMPLVFMIGKMEPVYVSQPAVIENIQPNSPAAVASLKFGDKIVEINNKAIGSWKDVLDVVAISANQDVTLELERSGNKIDQVVRVKEMADTGAGYIGVEPPLFIGNDPILDQVRLGSPAEKAGVKDGDVVTSIGGKKINTWLDMTEIVMSSDGKPLAFQVSRGAENLKLSVTPEFDKEANRYVIGVVKDYKAHEKDLPMQKVNYGFVDGVKKGMEEMWRLTSMTFTVLKKLVTGQLSYKSLGGPIKIAQISAAAAHNGLANFIFFLGFLSLQLGILNLLPIPVLDGGHIIFFAIEAIRRKPLSERIQGIAQHVGMALLILLMVVVSINDLLSFETIRNFIHKIF